MGSGRVFRSSREGLGDGKDGWVCLCLPPGGDFER